MYKFVIIFLKNIENIAFMNKYVAQEIIFMDFQ